LRTFIHEEVYRTAGLMDRIGAANLLFCGAGAVGSNLIENVCRQGFKRISAIDMDRVEDHNRNSQIWGKRDIGQLKVQALKSRIYFDMGISLEAIAQKLESSSIKKLLRFNNPGKHNLVVDGFDNSESRELVTEYCLKNRIDCLHVGLFQDYAEVLWNEGYRVPKATGALDVCEYPLARNVVLMAVAVATEAIISWINTGEKKGYYITLKDLKINQAQ